jgi:hypothetical protein
VAGLVRRIKRIWVTLGLAATSDEGVSIVHAGGRWELRPRTAVAQATGLLFSCRALVDPRAYADILQTCTPSADAH